MLSSHFSFIGTQEVHSKNVVIFRVPSYLFVYLFRGVFSWESIGSVCKEFLHHYQLSKCYILIWYSFLNSTN